MEKLLFVSRIKVFPKKKVGYRAPAALPVPSQKHHNLTPFRASPLLATHTHKKKKKKKHSNDTNPTIYPKINNVRGHTAMYSCFFPPSCSIKSKNKS